MPLDECAIRERLDHDVPLAVEAESGERQTEREDRQGGGESDPMDHEARRISAVGRSGPAPPSARLPDTRPERRRRVRIGDTRLSLVDPRAPTGIRARRGSGRLDSRRRTDDGDRAAAFHRQVADSRGAALHLLRLESFDSGHLSIPRTSA